MWSVFSSRAGKKISGLLALLAGDCMHRNKLCTLSSSAAAAEWTARQTIT